MEVPMLGTFGTTFGTTMDWKNGIRLQALTLLAMTLAACGGGSPDSSVPQNRAPSANAGIDQSVDEFASVMLDGSGSSDPDGDPLTYSWSQTGGSSVDIINADSVTASFDAPDVLASETPVVLTFRLTVSDGTATGTASVDEHGETIHVGDFRAQCWRTWRNLTELLKSEGATWHDIVRTTCYLRDIERDYRDFNEIRTHFFHMQNLDPLPASTGIQARICREDLLVEIEAIALLERGAP